jgi:hypothetical protein
MIGPPAPTLGGGSRTMRCSVVTSTATSRGTDSIALRLPSAQAARLITRMSSDAKARVNCPVTLGSSRSLRWSKVTERTS